VEALDKPHMCVVVVVVPERQSGQTSRSRVRVVVTERQSGQTIPRRLRARLSRMADWVFNWAETDVEASPGPVPVPPSTSPPPYVILNPLHQLDAVVPSAVVESVENDRKDSLLNC